MASLAVIAPWAASASPSGASPTGPTRGGAAVSAAGLWAGASTRAAVSSPTASGAASDAPGGQGAARPSGSTALTLLSQTPWVAPGQPFDLEMRAAPVPSSAALGISVAVYACLSSVSAFDQSVSSSGPSGTPITSTRTPLLVSGLAPVAGGGFDLRMPVVAGRAAVSVPAGGFAIHLAAAGDQCGAYPSGVYPVRVQLVDTASGNVIGGLTTHLIYTDAAPGTERLRSAVVLPLQTAAGPAASPSELQLLARPSAALQPPTARTLARVTDVVGSIADHPAVPVTVEASAQTVAALADAGRQSALGQLAQLAGSPHQVASSPFVPVNAAALVDAGLAAELGLQITRGTQVLASEGIRPPAGQGSGGSLGAWISGDPIDAGTITALIGDGYRQLVLPAGSVTGSPTNGSADEPFQLSSSTHGSSVPAVAADTDLTARFTAEKADPVLAAHQLVAELAQIYYEKPNATEPRAVVAVPPTGWSADPTFVTALLASLGGDPIVEPVTVAGLFSSMPEASCRSDCRLVSPGKASGLPAAAIRTQRDRIQGFSSAAGTAGAHVTTELGDLVLSGQSEELRPSQQSAVLHNTSVAIDAQLDQLAVAGDRTITLTSQGGTIPVTVVSRAPYEMTATLTLTSDKLLFHNGTTRWTQPVTLKPTHTNVIPIAVRTRVSGLFTVDISLHAPDGGLELTAGQIAVRSTATSVVGIALSLGAVIVLLVWWLRTSRKRRWRRRQDRLAEAAGPDGP